MKETSEHEVHRNQSFVYSNQSFVYGRLRPFFCQGTFGSDIGLINVRISALELRSFLASDKPEAPLDIPLLQSADTFETAVIMSR